MPNLIDVQRPNKTAEHRVAHGRRTSAYRTAASGPDVRPPPRLRIDSANRIKDGRGFMKMRISRQQFAAILPVGELFPSSRAMQRGDGILSKYSCSITHPPNASRRSTGSEIWRSTCGQITARDGHSQPALFPAPNHCTGNVFVVVPACLRATWDLPRLRSGLAKKVSLRRIPGIGTTPAIRFIGVNGTWPGLGKKIPKRGPGLVLSRGGGAGFRPKNFPPGPRPR